MTVSTEKLLEIPDIQNPEFRDASTDQYLRTPEDRRVQVQSAKKVAGYAATRGWFPPEFVRVFYYGVVEREIAPDDGEMKTHGNCVNPNFLNYLFREPEKGSVSWYIFRPEG